MRIINIIRRIFQNTIIVNEKIIYNGVEIDPDSKKGREVKKELEDCRKELRDLMSSTFGKEGFFK